MHWGIGYWGAFVLVLLIAFAGGIAIERIVIRPVENAPLVTIVIVTVGLFLVVNGAAVRIWTGLIRQFPAAFPTRPIRVGDVAFSLEDLGTIGVSIGAVVLLW